MNSRAPEVRFVGSSPIPPFVRLSMKLPKAPTKKATRMGRLLFLVPAATRDKRKRTRWVLRSSNGGRAPRELIPRRGARPVTLGDHAIAFGVFHGCRRASHARTAEQAIESPAPGVCRNLQLSAGPGRQQGQWTGHLPVSDRSIERESVAARSDTQWFEPFLPRFGPLQNAPVLRQ